MALGCAISLVVPAFAQNTVTLTVNDLSSGGPAAILAMLGELKAVAATGKGNKVESQHLDH